MLSPSKDAPTFKSLTQQLYTRGQSDPSSEQLRLCVPLPHQLPIPFPQHSIYISVSTLHPALPGLHRVPENQFTSVQSLSRVRLFATPWPAACQVSLSITNSQSLLELMSIELGMPSNHLIFCRPLILPPSIFPIIRVFSNKSSSHQVARVLESQLQHQSFQ